LKDGFIVSGKGRRPDQRVNIGHIRAWQEIWISGGVPFICIQLHDGTSVDWNDKYGSLFEILRVVAEDKEQPFAYV
jgi:hypothetical protein